MLKFCRYECIENDLLGSLLFGIHNIAPYHSKGIEKATELSHSSKACNAGTGKEPDEDIKGKLVSTYFFPIMHLVF